ncbi:apolipoprotein L5-like isoform X2 [Narcine bancroftii]
MELVSKADWHNLLTKFACIQVGAVIFFLVIKGAVSESGSNLFKLLFHIGYIQVGVGVSFLLITELVSIIDWKEFLKTFIITSCIQVIAGFSFLLFIGIKSKTAENNVLETFVQTNCIQFGAGFLFLAVTELVSNTALHELIVQPNNLQSRHHYKMWISDWKNMLQTFISTNCIQIGVGFFFLIVTELVSKTGNTLANFQILFLKWIKQSTAYMTELRMIANFIEDYHRGATIVNIAASSAGLAGGILSIIGLIIAPFTTGDSLVLTGVGLTLSAAGGVSKIIAYVTDNIIQKRKQIRVNEIVGQYVKETKHLTDELILINRAIQYTIKNKERDLVMNVFLNASRTLTDNLTCISAVTLTVMRSTSGTFVAISGALASLIVMWDIFCIVQGAQEFHRGRRTEIAQLIRQIAQHMEDEVEYIENEFSKCESDYKHLFTFLSEHGTQGGHIFHHC